MKKINPLTVALGALTVFRISGYIVYDSGPLNVFKRFRGYVKSKAEDEEIVFPAREKGTGPWSNLDEGVNCPYCVGTWIAIAVTLAVLILPQKLYTPMLFLFGIAGAQNAIERTIEGIEEAGKIKEFL